MGKIFYFALFALAAGVVLYTGASADKAEEERGFAMETAKNENVKEIYLAGGCFWGVQAYLDKIPGVVNTEAGYANGGKKNPAYEEIAKTGHAETVRVQYDKTKITLEKLLEIFFGIIDPTSMNKQGNDRGAQYRTGVYYVNEKDVCAAKKVFAEEERKYDKPVVVELKPLENFYPAEEYHQKYLKKNPGGYCHIDLSGADKYK